MSAILEKLSLALGCNYSLVRFFSFLCSFLLFHFRVFFELGVWNVPIERETSKTRLPRYRVGPACIWSGYVAIVYIFHLRHAFSRGVASDMCNQL